MVWSQSSAAATPEAADPLEVAAADLPALVLELNEKATELQEKILPIKQLMLSRVSARLLASLFRWLHVYVCLLACVQVFAFAC